MGSRRFKNNTHSDQNNDSSQVDSITCKIFCLKNIITSVAGNVIASYATGKKVFDVNDEIIKALSEATDIIQALQVFKCNMMSIYSNLLISLKKDDPGKFDSLLKNNSLMQGVVCAFINDSSYVKA